MKNRTLNNDPLYYRPQTRDIPSAIEAQFPIKANWIAQRLEKQQKEGQFNSKAALTMKIFGKKSPSPTQLNTVEEDADRKSPDNQAILKI